MGIAERTDSASVPISSACGCTIPPLFFIYLSTLQTSFEIISQDPGGNLREGDERGLADLAFPAELRVDEAERVQFLHVLPELCVGRRLLVIFLAHEVVGLCRVAHRDVRFLASLSLDQQA